MIYSYTNSDQTIATNGKLAYATDAIKTGCTVRHTPGGTTFNLVKPGYYYVTVTAVGAASATATTPLVLQLFNGSNAVAGATASELSTGTSDIVDLTINTIIKVCPSCCAIDNSVAISVVNTGISAIYSNTTITITKIA